MNKRNIKTHVTNVNFFFNNELVVKNNLERIKFDCKINWDYIHNSAESTYQVYLHSLNIVNDLMIVGIEHHNNKFLKEAYKIIMDWFNYIEKSNNIYIWHEHAVSARISNIIKFQMNSPKYKLKKKIFNKILNSHCQFLSDEKNYKNNNHGLMMDKSLIYAANYLSNENQKLLYIEKALYRVKSTIFRDFSDKGVHLENSPEYHLFVMKLVKDIKFILKNLNISLGKDIDNLLYRASKYPAYIIKPDGTYPNIGDTGTMRNAKKLKFYKDFTDYEASIVIFQNKNNAINKNSCHFTFKSGYKRLTHKHKDDLSVTYYVNGHDILVDSGKYNYNYKDSNRQYIVSPMAHNTITIENETYELQNPYEDQLSLNIRTVRNQDNFKIVSGINNLYKDSSLIRTCILDDDDSMIIIDQAKSKNPKSFIQNFNLHEDLTIKQINDYKYEIRNNHTIYYLESFHIDNIKMNMKTAEGLISRKFSEVVKNQKINIKKSGKSTTFITALYKKKNEQKFKEITFKNNTLNYKNSQINI